jgi:hypothetical protein
MECLEWDSEAMQPEHVYIFNQQHTMYLDSQIADPENAFGAT